MASKVLNKINTKLEFLYHHSRYLTPAYKRLLCNSLIQPHFDYGCSSWFPILKKKLKVKLQKAPNKYIYTYLLKFISQISHGSIALHKKKLASGWQQSRIPYWEYSFKYWNGFKLRYIHECLSLNSSNIAKVQRWSWTYLCGKQIHGKKLIVIRAKVMVQNKL